MSTAKLCKHHLVAPEICAERTRRRDAWVGDLCTWLCKTGHATTARLLRTAYVIERRTHLSNVDRYKKKVDALRSIIAREKARKKARGMPRLIPVTSRTQRDPRTTIAADALARMWSTPCESERE